MRPTHVLTIAFYIPLVFGHSLAIAQGQKSALLICGAADAHGDRFSKVTQKMAENLVAKGWSVINISGLSGTEEAYKAAIKRLGTQSDGEVLIYVSANGSEPREKSTSHDVLVGSGWELDVSSNFDPSSAYRDNRRFDGPICKECRDNYRGLMKSMFQQIDEDVALLGSLSDEHFLSIAADIKKDISSFLEFNGKLEALVSDLNSPGNQHDSTLLARYDSQKKILKQLLQSMLSKERIFYERFQTVGAARNSEACKAFSL
jgi:hypothetical protein